MRLNMIPRHPGPHENCPGQNGGRLKKKLFPRDPVGKRERPDRSGRRRHKIGPLWRFDPAFDRTPLTYPLQDRVECDLMNNEPTKIAVFVDQVRIPRAKMIIRTAVDRMIEIERSRIKRQLNQLVRVEPCVAQQYRIGRAEYFERFFRNVVIRSLRHAGVFTIERDRCNPFVRVRLMLFLPLKNRNRSVTEKIVHLPNHLGSRPRNIRPGKIECQQSFRASGDKKRCKEKFVRLMKKQVGVKTSVARQNFIAQQCNRRHRPVRLTKRLARSGQFGQMLGKNVKSVRPDRRGPLTLQRSEQSVPSPPIAHVALAGSEVQVPQNIAYRR